MSSADISSGLKGLTKYLTKSKWSWWWKQASKTTAYRDRINWFNVNKILCEFKKSEIVGILRKKFNSDLKIKLCGKRLYPTESIKHLGVKIDKNLCWQGQANNLSTDLNRGNV